MILGWTAQLAGMALWTYGYFATGNPTIIDWQSIGLKLNSFLPNAEAEIGMAVMIAGMLPLYWPARGDAAPSGQPSAGEEK